MDPFTLFPDEISIDIVSYLPPVQLFQLRRVSKKWRNILSDKIAETKVVKRRGFDLAPGSSLQQKQRMCNHAIGRPTSVVGKRMFGNPRLFQLQDDELVFLVRPFHLSGHRLKIIIINLDTMSEKTYHVTIRGEFPQVFLTGKIVGVKTTREILCGSVVDEKLSRITPPAGQEGSGVMAHGSMLAIAEITAARAVTGFWTFDVATQTQSSITLDIAFAAPERSPYQIGYTCDADSITLFSVHTTPAVQHELSITRYTRAGKWQSRTTSDFQIAESARLRTWNLRVFATGMTDRYCLALKTVDGEIHLVVDVHEKNSELVARRGVLVWKDRFYKDSFLSVNGKHADVLIGEYDGCLGTPLAYMTGVCRTAEKTFYRSIGIAINDRCMVRLAFCRREIDSLLIFKYEGEAAVAKQFKASGGKIVELGWERHQDQREVEEYTKDEARRKARTQIRWSSGW